MLQTVFNRRPEHRTSTRVAGPFHQHMNVSVKDTKPPTGASNLVENEGFQATDGRSLEDASLGLPQHPCPETHCWVFNNFTLSKAR